MAGVLTLRVLQAYSENTGARPARSPLLSLPDALDFPCPEGPMPRVPCPYSPACHSTGLLCRRGVQ